MSAPNSQANANVNEEDAIELAIAEVRAVRHECQTSRACLMQAVVDSNVGKLRCSSPYDNSAKAKRNSAPLDHVLSRLRTEQKRVVSMKPPQEIPSR